MNKQPEDLNRDKKAFEAARKLWNEQRQRAERLDAMLTESLQALKAAEQLISDLGRPNGAYDRITELEKELRAKDERINGLDHDCWIYENTVRNLLERAEAAEAACEEAVTILNSGERQASSRSIQILKARFKAKENEQC